MTKTEQATEAFDQWSTFNSTITSLDFKNYLITNYTNEYWSQQWVSGFLQSLDLEYEVSDDRRYRIYTIPQPLTVSILGLYCDSLINAGKPVTKVALKSIVRKNDFPLDNFKELFNQLGLQFSGKYTSDNHKIWIRVPAGKHLSKNKGTLVNIKDMAKPYLRNTIAKYIAENGTPDMHYILGQPNSEFYKLLQAFFTYEIRNSI